MSAQTALILELLATAMMTGLIWFVQIVHYPLLAEVPTEAFARYESLHVLRTGWVVAPIMLVEITLAAGLVFLNPPGLNPLHAIAFVALLVVWLSTFFLQVPLHAQLREGAGASAIATLVATNWIRTLAWSTRLVLLAILAIAPGGKLH